MCRDNSMNCCSIGTSPRATQARFSRGAECHRSSLSSAPTGKMNYARAEQTCGNPQGPFPRITKPHRSCASREPIALGGTSLQTSLLFIQKAPRSLSPLPAFTLLSGFFWLCLEILLALLQQTAAKALMWARGSARMPGEGWHPGGGCRQ